MKNKSLGFLVVILLGCLLSGCYSNCAEIISPWEFKQVWIEENFGWALTTDNEVLYTKNGVEEFVPVKKIENICIWTDGFVNACFVDKETAYITYFSADGESIIVEHTENKGNSWAQTYIHYKNYAEICDAGYAYLSFADRENGFLLYCSTPAAGKMTKLLFHLDNTEEKISFAVDLTDELTGYPQGICFYDEDNGYIAVTYHGENNYLYKTEDGGLTWKGEHLPIEEDYNYIDGYAPFFYGDDGAGMLVLKAVGKNVSNILLTTTDYGKNWKEEEILPLDSVNGYSGNENGELFLIDNSGKLYQYMGCSGSNSEGVQETEPITELSEYTTENASSSSETMSDEDQQITSMLICWNNDVFSFENSILDIAGLYKNIEAILWIAPRGGAGIDSEGNQIKAASNDFIQLSENLTSGERLEENVLLIRINRKYSVENTPMSYKDVVMYRDNEDAYLAWQMADDPDIWHLFRLPGYGEWLEKEVAIFMRCATGF